MDDHIKKRLYNKMLFHQILKIVETIQTPITINEIRAKVLQNNQLTNSDLKKHESKALLYRIRANVRQLAKQNDIQTRIVTENRTNIDILEVLPLNFSE